MAILRSLISLIVCASMVMVQPTTAKRLLAPTTTADESSKQAFDAQNLKSLLCQNICPSPEPECPTEFVTSLSNLGLDIPDDGNTSIPRAVAVVTIPVTLGAGCSCTVGNVAIAFGIDHPNVSNLIISLVSPDGVEVLLVSLPNPANTANLVPGNTITFDDSDPNALDPQDWASLGDNDNIPAGTYVTLASTSLPPGEGGLIASFNDKVLPAAGSWEFIVADNTAGDTGTIESVDLTITCQ